MTRTFLLFLSMILFTRVQAQVTVAIFNHSSVQVDSIVIEGTKTFNVGGIAKGSKTSFSISVFEANFHSMAPFYIHLYSSVLNTRMQWMKRSLSDTLYFFDHGLSEYAKPPLRPQEFYLSVFNKSSFKIDSVLSSNDAIKEVRERTPRKFEIILDREKAEEARLVYFKLGQKTFSADLKSYHIDDWTRFSAYLSIGNDSLAEGWDRDPNSFEFVIDFEVDKGIALKDIEIKSPHLLKTYSNSSDIYPFRAVFDRASFQSDPVFELRIRRKTYVIKLKPHSLEEAGSHVCRITKKGVREL